MRVDQFNYVGQFRLKNSDGSLVTYSKFDVVISMGKTYIASRSLTGISPELDSNKGWLSLSDKQVFYESENEPFYANLGDEWFNKTTGVKYKRINNDFNEFWVEL